LSLSNGTGIAGPSTGPQPVTFWIVSSRHGGQRGRSVRWSIPSETTSSALLPSAASSSLIVTAEAGDEGGERWAIAGPSVCLLANG
jgi:hypothetical protein